MSTSVSPRSRAGMYVALVLAVGLAVGLVVWWLQRPRPVDMLAVLHLNNKGIGLMERFEYKEAAQVFHEIVDQAPDWLPGQINLGIALLNVSTAAELDRAIGMFQSVLRKEPQNNHAHFCLGIIYKHQGKIDESAGHFETVTRNDPKDAHAWFFLGTVVPLDSEQAKRCFEKARELDPYMHGAIYQLSQLAYRQKDIAKGKALHAESEKLKEAEAATVADIKYSLMGKYAEVIGRAEPVSAPAKVPLPLWQAPEGFKVAFGANTRWATRAEFGQGAEADLRRAVRQRFGGTMALLDYNKDGKPDVLLLGAVVRNDRVEDLLLKNEGDFVFRDVTEEAGLGGARIGLGASVADFDNDTFADVLFTCADGVRLFRAVPRDKQDPKFEDVTATAGLEQIKSACFSATFVDLDQDSDLDLLVGQYAANVADALANLKSPAKAKGPGWTLLLNVGEAPPNPTPEKLLPLKPKFAKGPDAFGSGVAAVNMTVTDIDGDRDLDVLSFQDGQSARLVLNDRLLRFHDKAMPLLDGVWNGALVLDVDRDGQSDLFAVAPGEKPAVVLVLPPQGEKTLLERLAAVSSNSPNLLQAQAVDMDLDGSTDVIGLSETGMPVLLRNDGKRLGWTRAGLGANESWPKDPAAVAAADLDGDARPDLLTWSEKNGLEVRRHMGNGNHGLTIELTGRHDKDPKMRSNADGNGVWLTAQAGDLWTGGENTTLAAGLGRSRLPFQLGLGKYAQADVVRLRWPDLTLQAELNAPADRLARIAQHNRMTGSCPLLFTWNGERFVNVTDFLGAGSIGESLPGGGHRPPRPEESVKIEAHQLVPKDGRYVLKLVDTMDEVNYIDRVQLVVVDHPAGAKSYPDERFSYPGPSQDLLVHRSEDEVFPVTATDHKGRDVTQALRHWDRATADGFARRAWLGFAEDHWVELDFGDRLSRFGAGDRVMLYLAGWTDYPYPESIWAADQAGVALLPPLLERLATDGKWQTVTADAGFPAGHPRMIVMDVTGKVGGPRCVLRLRTNMHVYWDQIFAAPVIERIKPASASKPADQSKPASESKPADESSSPRGDTAKHVNIITLDLHHATLSVRGCLQEFSPDGRLPRLFDYDKIEPVPVVRQTGKLTRTGDVTELLRERDDCFVIFGPGDELTATFAADRLPPLPAGWTRSFVLRTWGYCKDAAPFTATGSTIEPLPFALMSGFPYGPTEHYPRTPKHDDYQRRYNTRQVGPSRPR